MRGKSKASFVASPAEAMVQVDQGVGQGARDLLVAGLFERRARVVAPQGPRAQQLGDQGQVGPVEGGEQRAQPRRQQTPGQVVEPGGEDQGLGPVAIHDAVPGGQERARGERAGIALARGG